MDKEIYLGDGLYVSYDGEHITLRSPRVNSIDYIIYMNREVLIGFIEFLKLKKLIQDDNILHM